MNPITRDRLARIEERHEEVTRLLAEPDVTGQPDRFRELSREYSELETLVKLWRRYRQEESAAGQARALLDDSEMRSMAEDEIRRAEEVMAVLEDELQRMMLPRDANDQRNIFLEIRAGTGGQEAALFAGDLFRMYSRYAENRGWGVEVMSAHAGEQGGYKEIIARISGDGAYSAFKFESGTHRVQRVPATESQGRIHTSACTVAVLPEVDAVEGVDINPGDLRIDTYRSSGAGGQHVNTTDSAIRVTHLPSGIVVECQDERSQHKNKARALSLLSARLLQAEQEKQRDARARDRKLQVGSGDRSERIRTYNFPQGRITDHRINLTLYQLESVLEGDLDAVISPLTEQHQADLLAEMGA